MTLKIAILDKDDDEIRNQILEPLVKYNESIVGSSNYRPLVATLIDNVGNIKGGAYGFTGYDWLFVQLLVVDEDSRKQGWGKLLMNAMEEEAISRGCSDAWLDTYEFQAEGFYEKIGYIEFAELPNFPKGFSRKFFKKSL